MHDDLIPVVDLGRDGTSHQDGGRIAATIRGALERSGFLVVVGHGMPQAAIEGAHAAAATFFRSPRTVKQQVAARAGDPLFRGFLEPTPQVHEQFMMNRIGQSSHSPDENHARLAGENRWPSLPGFRDALQIYYDEVHALAMAIMRFVAISFDLPANWFDDKFTDHMTPLTLNYYYGGSSDAGGLRNPPHRDWSAMTILYQDDAPGGLQVRVGDHWIDVAHRPGSFVVNIGRLMSIWTNDTLTSTVHRVRSAADNGLSADRISIAYFLHPSPDTIVECLPTLSRSVRPHYHPVRSDLYFVDRSVRKQAVIRRE